MTCCNRNNDLRACPRTQGDMSPQTTGGEGRCRCCLSSGSGDFCRQEFECD